MRDDNLINIPNHRHKTNKESHFSAYTTFGGVGVCPVDNNCLEGLVLDYSEMNENLFSAEMSFRILLT
ncbi:MAG: hypothetical protein SNI87_06290 [Rikenellaceae bacterium]